MFFAKFNGQLTRIEWYLDDRYVRRHANLSKSWQNLNPQLRGAPVHFSRFTRKNLLFAFVLRDEPQKWHRVWQQYPWYLCRVLRPIEPLVFVLWMLLAIVFLHGSHLEISLRAP